MNTGAVTSRPRIGHLMATFGLFLSLLTLTFQATLNGKSYAFGTTEVAQLSNNYRISAGLPALISNQTLNNSAQAKANDMAAKGYFAHNAPDGTTPWYFFDSAGYAYVSAGENLALTNQSASSVVDGWFNSPGHKANMMSSTFTEVGYGIAFVPSFTYNGTTYADVYLVAAHYAQPVSTGAAATFTVNASTPTPAPAPAPAPQPTTASPTVQSVEPEPTKPTAEPTVQSQKTAESANETTTAQAQSTTSESGPGTQSVSKESPVILRQIAYGALGTGIALVLIGVVIEIRRLLMHQSIFPHITHTPHHR